MKSLPRTRGLAIALLCSALITSACGLKESTKDSLATSGGAGGGLVDPSTGEQINPGGDPAAGGDVGTGGDLGTGGAAAGGDLGTTTGGGSTGGAAGGSTGGAAGGGGGAAGGGGGGAAPTVEEPGDDGNTTGIEGKTVKIILHGPLTGAGVPQQSFKSGTPKYWQTHKLANGMSVDAEAVDDKYNAPDALRACNAAAKNAFLIVGGAGTDQITACAQSPVLKRGSVPYLSAGVTENGLGSLSHYFATSLTYKQQAPLVVKMAADYKFLSGKRWAVVITDTPNFTDARESIVKALKGAGVTPKVFLTDKAPTNCSTLAGQIRNNYDSIYFLGQPSFFVQCVGSIGYTPTYKPIYTGPGPSFGINSVGGLACRGSANQYQGYYLNPAPGLDTAPKLAPGASFADDIEYQIWGAMETLKQAFDQVQGKLTREKFIATLAKSGTKGGVFAPTNYAGKDRFGGTAAYGVKMNCTKGQQETLKQYR